MKKIVKVLALIGGFVLTATVFIGGSLFLDWVTTPDPVPTPNTRTIVPTPTTWTVGGKNPTVAHKDKDGSFRVSYATLNGHPVSLEFDAPTGRVALKVKSSAGFEFGADDESLEFMKDEVIRLTMTTNIVSLAEGYSLQFKGGYPTWAPYIQNSKVGVYRYLMFAEGATVTTDNVIVVQGWANKPDGHYPYLDSK